MEHVPFSSFGAGKTRQGLVREGTPVNSSASPLPRGPFALKFGRTSRRRNKGATTGLSGPYRGYCTTRGGTPMSWTVKQVFIAKWRGKRRIETDWLKCPTCLETMEPRIGIWHYTESGQDDIYLENIWIWECPQGHRMPEIPKVKPLHEKLNLTTQTLDKTADKRCQFGTQEN